MSTNINERRLPDYRHHSFYRGDKYSDTGGLDHGRHILFRSHPDHMLMCDCVNRHRTDFGKNINFQTT